MKSNLTIIAVGLGIIAIGAASAEAADWNNGANGIKDYTRGGVPVPAPAPVPDYAAKWYFRVDAGISFMDDPSVSERGMQFGLTDSPGATGPTPFGSSPAWFNKDFETSVVSGVGAGYIWSPRLRTDLTADVRSQSQVKGAGTYAYDLHAYQGGPPPVYLPIPDSSGLTNMRVEGSVRDNTTIRSGTILFNLYYDLGKFSHFTPYVGAGLGVALHEFERTHSTTENVCDNSTAPFPTCSAYRSTTGTDKSHSASFAWAAMVGASYNLTSATLIDFNYRYLNTGSTGVTLAAAGGASKVTIGETGEHQLRAGLRFNIE